MIIGFCGKLGSGKDTAAEKLAEMVSLPVERIAFADKLKDSAAAALGVERSLLEEHKNNPEAIITVSVGTDGVAMTEDEYIDLPVIKKQINFREYLQFVGTEAGRNIFGDNFWVDQALPDQYDYSDKLYTVTDVRFPNELARVQALGGTVVRIIGPNEETGTHASEQVLEGVDWEIDNTRRNDMCVSLKAQLQQMMYVLFGGEALRATTSGDDETPKLVLL